MGNTAHTGSGKRLFTGLCPRVQLKCWVQTLQQCLQELGSFLVLSLGLASFSGFCSPHVAPGQGQNFFFSERSSKKPQNSIALVRLRSDVSPWAVVSGGWNMQISWAWVRLLPGKGAWQLPGLREVMTQLKDDPERGPQAPRMCQQIRDKNPRLCGLSYVPVKEDLQNKYVSPVAW